MIRIFFDDTEISAGNIILLNQSVSPFDKNFKIGNTVCREFELQVLNNGFSSIPSIVTIKEDNNNYATLIVDSYDNKNKRFTVFNLTDYMVRFNAKLTYTQGNTTKQILQSICSKYGIQLVNTSFYMDDFAITWDEMDITERDFISFVAEVNGGYAFINNDGNLEIKQYSNSYTDTIDIDRCSSFSQGGKHLYDRVYLELGTATHYYPDSSDNDTLYLNPNNVLFTDSGDYTIDGIISHIYSIINGLEFYDIEIGRCPINANVKACDMIRIKVNNTYVNTLAVINWNYYKVWNGGYKLEIQSSIQQETEVKNQNEEVKRLSIRVDRELGEIHQDITDIETNVQNNYYTKTQTDSKISQSASDIKLEVSQTYETKEDASATYETKQEAAASLELKIDKTDNDQIISMINASADNIILNTKSLIFGEYPDGQYIEVKNYLTNKKGFVSYLEQKNNGYFSSIFAPAVGTDYTYEIEFETGDDIETSQAIFGSYPTDYSTSTVLGLYIESVRQMKVCYSTQNSFASTAFDMPVQANTKYKVVINVVNGSNIVGTAYVDDVQVGSLNGVIFYYKNKMLPISLFAMSSSATPTTSFDYFTGKIYSFKVYSSSTMIRNFSGYTDGDFIFIEDGIRGDKILASGELSSDAEQIKSGVLFDGSGYVIFKPQDKFNVLNITEDGNKINDLTMSSDSLYGNEIQMLNYDDSNVAINEFLMSRRYKDIYQTAPENCVGIWNYENFTGNRYTANEIWALATEISASFNIYNYKQQSEYVANSINMSRSEDNAISFYNYLPNTNDRGNTLSLLSRTNYTQITLNNRTLDGNRANNFLMESSSNGTNTFTIHNYKKITNDIANELIMMSWNDYGSNSITLNNYDENTGDIRTRISLYKSENVNRLELSLLRNNSDIAYIGLVREDQDDPRITLNAHDIRLFGTVYYNYRELYVENGFVKAR